MKITVSGITGRDITGTIGNEEKVTADSTVRIQIELSYTCKVCHVIWTKIFRGKLYDASKNGDSLIQV